MLGLSRHVAFSGAFIYSNFHCFAELHRPPPSVAKFSELAKVPHKWLSIIPFSSISISLVWTRFLFCIAIELDLNCTLNWIKLNFDLFLDNIERWNSSDKFYLNCLGKFIGGRHRRELFREVTRYFSAFWVFTTELNMFTGLNWLELCWIEKTLNHPDGTLNWPGLSFEHFQPNHKLVVPPCGQANTLCVKSGVATGS